MAWDFAGEVSFEDSFGGGEWQAFDLEEEKSDDRLNASSVSDIEVAREADRSLLALDESTMLGALNKSLHNDSAAMDVDQPEFSIEAFDDMPALDIDNSLDMPPSPSGNALEVSSDLNVSIHNGSRASLDFGAALNEEEGDASILRPKKKRKIGRDSVTELSSAFLKNVGDRVLCLHLLWVWTID